MNAEYFINNFGHLVDAPEGPMRIRELILQLAFSGDLTTRSAGDEHASVVFDLNQQTKANWIGEGKIRQQPSLNRLSDVEYPWDLPKTWRWCRLGEVTTYGATDKAEFSDVTPETWVLELEDIEKDTSRLLGKVRAKDRRFQSSKNRFSNGDVLYGKLRPYLDKVVLADEDGVCTTEIIPITIYSGILPEYLRWFLKSPFFKGYANGSTHGMNLPRMGTEAGRNAVFPLAPLAEQKRIVAKVDELMVLCDQLEAQQQERERLFPVLSCTCHARFAEAPTPANINRIFDETGGVAPNDLRKTILTLAVQGKLLPQDLDDEPVEVLLARNDLHRRKLARKDRRADNENQSLLSLEDCWDIAHMWEWRGLADLVLFVDYRGKTPTKISGGVRLLTAKNVRKGEINRSPEEFLSETDYQKWMTRGFPKPGDVLFTTEAPMGNAAVVQLTERFALAQRVICFQSYGAVEPSFLVMQILSDGFQRILDKNGTGVTAKGIKASKLKRLPIAVPPLAEQRRIVAKVDELMDLVDQLEAQQQERNKLAEAFAKACVTSFTGTTQLERPEKMKAPKTELVSFVTLGKKPKPNAKAPLAQLLIQHKGTLPAKSLWQQSGLTIDAFYQQLKTEIAQGWIAPPAEAEMKSLEDA